MNSTFGDLEKIMLDDLIEYTFDASVCFNNLHTVNFAMLDAENGLLVLKNMVLDRGIFKISNFDI